MPSTGRRLATAMTLLTLPCAACAPIVIQSAAGNCGRYIPEDWRKPVDYAAQPVSAKLPDGHDDARPWQSGFAAQTTQLQIANDRDAAKDHIRDVCEADQAAALKKSRRGFLGLF